MRGSQLLAHAANLTGSALDGLDVTFAILGSDVPSVTVAILPVAMTSPVLCAGDM